MRTNWVRRFAFAISVIGVVCPQRTEAQVVGIYADSLATSCNLTISFPGPPVDVYVVFTPGPLADSTGGASFRIVGLPDGWSGEAFVNPEGDWCSPCSPFEGPVQITFPTCQGPVVLFRLRLTPHSAVTDHELQVVTGVVPHGLSCPLMYGCGNQAGTSLPYARARINSMMACSPVIDGSCPWTDAVDLPPAETNLVIAPNPPAQSAAIYYMLAPELQSTRLTLYDLRGRVVARIFEGSLPSREGSVTWDGRDTAGKTVGAGIYILRLETDAGGGISRKIAWIR